MKLDYETLRDIVDTVPLPEDMTSETLYTNDEFSIVRPWPHTLIKYNGSEYSVRFLAIESKKAFLLPSGRNRFTIGVHYDAPSDVQRSWILHELVEGELFRQFCEREHSHKIASTYERRYCDEKGLTDTIR